MKKEKKETKTFIIADKTPYIGVILEILWAYLLTSVIGPMVAGIAVRIYERTTGNSFLNQEIVSAVVSIIVSIIFLCYATPRKQETGYLYFYSIFCAFRNGSYYECDSRSTYGYYDFPGGCGRYDGILYGGLLS